MRSSPVSRCRIITFAGKRLSAQRVGVTLILGRDDLARIHVTGLDALGKLGHTAVQLVERMKAEHLQRRLVGDGDSVGCPDVDRVGNAPKDGLPVWVWGKGLGHGEGIVSPRTKDRSERDQRR